VCPLSVNILFFGATAEETGTRTIDIELPDGSTVGTALERVLHAYPVLTRHKLLVARNEAYASRTDSLHHGDQVAIFTAVSGG
jgi:molybdopterin converting factor small subunit